MNEMKIQYVVVGGGAGGLGLASMLGRKFGPDRVALVDCNLYHVWKPSLHEAAAGSLDIHQEGLPYQMLAHHNGFQFIYGRMIALNAQDRTAMIDMVVHDGETVLPCRTIEYERVVLAVGSVANHFGIPGASEHTHSLNSAEDAEAFRNRFLARLAATEYGGKDGHGRQLDIVIIGGGATGVELAAELNEAAHSLQRYGFARERQSTSVRITILEGGARILGPLPERVSASAGALLAARNIDVVTSCRVTTIEADRVIDATGKSYKADLCVWAAGIRAPDFLKTLGLQTNRAGQIEVDTCLRAEGASGVYALGDCAFVIDGLGSVVPPRAQAAYQQAKYLFGAFVRESQDARAPDLDFIWQDKGSLVSVGWENGVGNLMGNLFRKTLFVQGWYARLMYASLHLLHHKEVLGLWRTLAAGLSRLLMGRIRPKVKLH